jgi:acyl-CoA synthetase (AMP-forming)/AMP-acid ligase II
VTPRVESLLAGTVERYGERPALAFGEAAALSYAELAEAVDLFSARLAEAVGGRDLGGARVAVVAPNVPALVISLFATWRLGGVPVPLNARLREHELSQVLADAEPVVVLSVREHLGYAFTELFGRLLPNVPSVRACLLVEPTGEIESELESPTGSPEVPQRFPRGTPDAETAAAAGLGTEVAAVLYTSGTTGTSKGALVAHGREVAAPRELASVLDLTPDDGVALVIPVSHAFGLTCLLSAVAAGSKAVLVESTTTLAPLQAAIERHRATVLHGSPALFAGLLKARPELPPTIRAGFVGGAPSAPGLQARLDEFGILNLYGLTETGAVSCCRPNDPPQRRRTTAGRAIADMELRFVDGELQVRGPAVTPGYFRRPEETALAFEDGWFRTGDVGEIEDGYLRISGRLKELVHVGGFNVFPAEVEAVLLTHPDVLQAAALGVPDERMGEVLQAFVVARRGSKLTPADLLGFARGRIAGYKLPYAIRFLPELPLLPSGKPDRRALAAR